MAKKKGFLKKGLAALGSEIRGSVKEKIKEHQKAQKIEKTAFQKERQKLARQRGKQRARQRYGVSNSNKTKASNNNNNNNNDSLFDFRF